MTTACGGFASMRYLNIIALSPSPMCWLNIVKTGRRDVHKPRPKAMNPDAELAWFPVAPPGGACNSNSTMRATRIAIVGGMKALCPATVLVSVYMRILVEKKPNFSLP